MLDKKARNINKVFMNWDIETYGKKVEGNEKERNLLMGSSMFLYLEWMGVNGWGYSKEVGVKLRYCFYLD